MKLYAVTVKAGLLIDGVPYKKLRHVPISKAAGVALVDRAEIPYAPAVFTNKTNAQKLIAKLRQRFGHEYEITSFDSGWVDYPEPR